MEAVRALPKRRDLALLAILAVAAAVRIVGLDHESYTMDEVDEIYIASRPVGEIIWMPDGFPPLYHLLLKGWITATGGTEDVRWLSVLVGVVAVWIVYVLASDIGNYRVALSAAGLLAISPIHVWSSQEARGYSLTFLLAGLAFWRFARALRTNSGRDWLVYVAVALTGLYTHYYFSLLIALHALWAAGSVARGRPPWPAITAHAIIAFLGAPVLVLVRGDFPVQAGFTLARSFSIGEFGYTLYAFLVGFSTGLSLRELHATTLEEAIPAFLPWLLILAVCFALLVPPLARSFRGRSGQLAYLALMTAAPVLLCGLAGNLMGVGYKVHYVLWALIPFALVVGCAVAEGWGQLLPRLALVMYVALAAASLANRHLVDRHRNEDTRALSTYLWEHGSPAEPVLVTPSYMAEPVRFYLGPYWPVNKVRTSSGSTALPAPLAVDTPPPFWLVYTRPFHGDPDNRLRHYLDTRHDIRLVARFPGIELYRAERS